ncbi:MAG TPA: hypothetical protein VJP77_06810, partial [Planctomycetota bacterium]|nr:hypothetical protein [Planctomycetota bacterium]
AERADQAEAGGSAGVRGPVAPKSVPDAARRAMMSQLLEANLSLRRALAAGQGGGGAGGGPGSDRD